MKTSLIFATFGLLVGCIDNSFHPVKDGIGNASPKIEITPSEINWDYISPAGVSDVVSVLIQSIGTNCFLLLSQTDSGDPGMNTGINLLCGAVIGIGAEFGIIGAVIANYFCGLVSEYSVTKPPSLLTTYTSYNTRIQATSMKADNDIATSNADPVANWNIVYSGSFNTPWGIKSASCTLGQLAAIDVPSEIDQSRIKPKLLLFLYA